MGHYDTHHDYEERQAREKRLKDAKRERIQKIVDDKTMSALKVSPSELVNILTELL